MNFDLSPELMELRDRTRRFIAERVIPLESDSRQGAHGPGEELRRELVERGRAAGLLTPHASREVGGLGLTHVKKAVVFEEAELSMNALDRCFIDGHGVLRSNDLRVPAKDVLGEVGKRFRYRQVRLAPARLTHCMRWLGQARRAHDVAVAYASRRHAFGKTLTEHEGVGFMLADNDTDLHTAWMMDQGHKCNLESSRATAFVRRLKWGLVDRSVQILGGRGTTDDTPVMQIFAGMRSFRIYDGPNEVPRWSPAQKFVKTAEQAKAVV